MPVKIYLSWVLFILDNFYKIFNWIDFTISLIKLAKVYDPIKIEMNIIVILCHKIDLFSTQGMQS